MPILDGKPSRPDTDICVRMVSRVSASICLTNPRPAVMRKTHCAPCVCVEHVASMYVDSVDWCDIWRGWLCEQYGLVRYMMTRPDHMDTMDWYNI